MLVNSIIIGVKHEQLEYDNVVNYLLGHLLGLLASTSLFISKDDQLAYCSICRNNPWSSASPALASYPISHLLQPSHPRATVITTQCDDNIEDEMWTKLAREKHLRGGTAKRFADDNQRTVAGAIVTDGKVECRLYWNFSKRRSQRGEYPAPFFCFGRSWVLLESGD